MRRAAVSERYAHWWRQLVCVVSPIRIPPVLAASLGCMLRRPGSTQQASLGSTGVSAVDLILSVVALFLFGGTFRVSPRSLAVRGASKKLEGARTRRGEYEFSGRVGGVAAVARGPLRGKHVRLEEREGEVDASALGASLDTVQDFNLPDDRGVHCWHSVRMHHRCRLLRANESPCERWGSLVHMLWDSYAGWQPHRVVARLFIREAGFACRGDELSEGVVREIARSLSDEGARPFTKQPSTREHLFTGVDASPENQTVRRGLREVALDSARLKHDTWAKSMSSSAAEAVKVAQATGVQGALGPLPACSANASIAAQNRADSVLRHEHEEWLGSKEAAEWRQARQAMFDDRGGLLENDAANDT